MSAGIRVVDRSLWMMKTLKGVQADCIGNSPRSFYGTVTLS